MLPPLYLDQQEDITMPVTEDQSFPAFARTAAADVFGKLDAEIPAIRIDSDTLIKLHQAANELGISISELVRVTARIRVWGEDHVETVSRNHLKRIMGNAGTLRGTAA